MRFPRGRARTRIVVGILAIQATAVAIYVTVDGQMADRAVTSQMETILDLSAKTATVDVDAYVSAMERAATEVIADVRDAGADQSRTEDGLFSALAYVPHLSGAYVGDSDGAFLYVRHAEDGFVTKRIRPANARTGRQVLLVKRNPELEIVTSKIDRTDEYDPRVRPWFRDAQQANGMPIWTAPYVFFTSQQPGMTRAALITGERPQVVVGVDFELSAVVDLLDRLATNITGEVTIRTPGGLLLTPRGVFEADDLPAEDVARTQALEDNVLQELSDHRVMYEFDGTTHIRHVAQVGPAGDRWLLALDLSDQDVVSPMLSVFSRQRSLAIIIGSLAVLIMALMVRSPLQRLETESTTDALTRLSNRREILRLGARLAEETNGYSVAMIDVDRFKRVNDRFGHMVGDEVLRGLAERLTIDDVPVGRLGGEEFLLLLSPDSPCDIHEHLAQVRADVASRPFETGIGPVTVTISIGVMTHTEDVTFSTVLAGADAALLAAKRLGRDQILRFEDLGTIRLPDEAAPTTELAAR